MSSILSMLEPLANAVGLESSWLLLLLLVALLTILVVGISLFIKKPKKRAEVTRVATKAPEALPEVKTKPIEEIPAPKPTPKEEARELSVKPTEAIPALKPTPKEEAPEVKAEPEKEIPAKTKAAPPIPEIKAEPPADLVKERPASTKGLGAALKNTRSGFMAKLASLFSRSNELSDEDFEEMEAILFSADIGAKTAQKLLDALKERVKIEKPSGKAAIHTLLKEEMRAIFKRAPYKEQAIVPSPAVYIFVGVNGAGKTTSIGKLGAQMAASGKKVFFGAGDTFRAAAVEQLSIWGERSGIQVVKGKENADSASVLFDAISQAKLAQADVVLCDTAGRLHTKVGLMDELKKVHRVLHKAQEGAPHEVFLVIDATMGQNAIAQAREFQEATPLTGIVLSKLDGTAKGGVALGIVDELLVPIRFVGIGEKPDDLKPFDPDEFVDALFSEN